ncbi:conserved Plasmodium protein, unknown function [Plasmodium sp. gorilla clade G2]|uniref:conserved Plasmodium protein, unknown function n=1 Tax=Plasmodium sp. gorilla clade G2 TaxID=880535 RepID=UPI000D22A3CE|nr:conserved Plasmodium protein, unknown function [Plasmodium sp. gorilla clade G2]SOV13153.1 conserved Plasmodium protein, unknown function [Plasmodium sp. gorilla clade G2]
MNFFFLLKEKNNINLECLNNDKINLYIFLDDIYYRSGDIFRCIIQVIGPEKYIGNIKLDYVVLYIYGICIFNNDIISVSEELLKRHDNIHLPFYKKKEDTNEKKFLIFYTNSIILCSDILFNKCNNNFYYSLECLLPYFIPPTYNGNNVKIKYYLYVEALKRLYKNTKDFITKKYQANYSIHIINTKYKNNPILNFSYYPIKPYDIKLYKENERHTYLHHNFYIYIKELGNTNKFINNSHDINKKKNNNNNNINYIYKPLLYKTIYNISYIPTHIYNNIQKSNFDCFICIYNLFSQRKEDSSIFLLNYIIPNYNYFYYLHCFLYLIYHYNYFQNFLKCNRNYKKFYLSSINNNASFFLSILENIEKANTKEILSDEYNKKENNEKKNINDNTKEILSDEYNKRENNEKKNINDNTKEILSDEYNKKENNEKKNINDNTKEILSDEYNKREHNEKLNIYDNTEKTNTFNCSNKSLNEEKQKNADIYHMNDIHPIMYDDKDLHNFYFCKYENFTFNDIIYEPVLWFDNLIVDNYNKVTTSKEEKDTHIEKSNEIIKNNQNGDLEDTTIRKDHDDNKEKNIKKLKNNTSSNEKIGDLSNDNVNSDTEKKIICHLNEKKNNNEYNIIYNNKFYKMDTIIKYMIRNNMFRYYINKKKIKNDFITNNVKDQNMKYEKTKKMKINSPNIYNINTNNKNVCIISLKDKINNKITNVFNYNNSIINININLRNSEVCIKHIDISLKRLEKIRLKKKFFNISKNRSFYDENDIIEEEYYSSSSYKTTSYKSKNTSLSSSSTSTSSLQLNVPSEKKKKSYNNVLCSNKKILEQHISTLSCCEKNINIILNEDIIPTFENDIISIDYFIDMDFYCFNNKDNTLQPFSLQTSFDHVYNMSFRIPIYIIDTMQYEGSINMNSTNFSTTMIEDETFDMLQINLIEGHKYDYVDKRCYIKNLEI